MELLHGSHNLRRKRRMDKATARELITQLQRTIINASFDLKILEMEGDLQRVSGQIATPKYGSRPYYARAMLDTIAVVRRLRGMGSRAATDAALSAAMRIGWLAAESTAKGWPVVREGVRAPKQRRRASALGVQEKRERRAADGEQRTFEAAVNQLFRQYPRHTYRQAAHSPSLARFRKPGPKALNAFAKRIALYQQHK
jgi:hypothetical protein